MPSEERSRDSAAKIAADRSLLSDDELIRRITALADEGSGIGELREALAPYLQHRVDCRNRLRMGQRDCSCGLADILAASPDIDRSGLAQEVE